MKTCINCGEIKSLESFHKHPQMLDGRLGKCRECCIEYARQRRIADGGRLRERDRIRNKSPKRIEQRKQYLRNYHSRHPEACRAHAIVSRAVRRGSLKQQPCAVCGTDIHVHAHHDDYAKPLDVVWLCALHHAEAHAAKDAK